MSYVKVSAVGVGKVQDLLDKGWVIIDQTKSVDGPELRMTYHMGYPATKRIEELMAVINEYEQHGFKQKLFEIKASENGESVEDIDAGGILSMEESELANYMSWYESVITNSEVNLYKTVNVEFKF